MTSLKVAYEIIKTIQEAGFEAFICGGAVRDILLEMPYEDIDITTSAKPHQVMALFESKPTGIKYGTVTVYVKEYAYEVTTFRTDGPSEDQRHPDYVYYGTSPLDDAMRRDFTINGMFKNLDGEIIDFVSGLEDLKRKVIKAIGDPLTRFSEDGLRMLRALYFQAKLNFDIDVDTLEAMRMQGLILMHIPKERVMNELLKIIKSPYAKRAFKTMQDIHYDDIIPGIKKTIAFYLSHDIDVTIDVFFGLSMYFSKEEMSYFPFPNKQRHKYEKAASRAKLNTPIQKIDVYNDGIEIMKLTGWLMHHIHGMPFKPSQIEHMDTYLVVRSILDLKMKPKEMMALAHKPAGAWIKEVQEEMIKEIHKGTLENSREALFIYFRSKYVKVVNKS
jgi:tRNA nucleotidyltransferase (CCA-adding enzyme)